MTNSPTNPIIHTNFDAKSRIVLFPGNAETFITSIPDDSIQLILTSPPYNLGKEYESRSSIEDYIASQTPLIKELCRILSPSGSVCWQVGNFVSNGEVIPLDICYYPILKEAGLVLRNRIIWKYEHGLHASRKFSGRYETILWFTKPGDYTFNLDVIRIPAKYPGKLHSRGPKKGQPSGNPKGKNPGDFWEILEEDWGNEIWDIPNVKANHPEKTLHPCQFPVELAERCILALSNENDWVFDPFAGVGSTLLAAIKNNRKAAGSEKEDDYIEIARNRIRAFYNGELNFRPIGKPIYQPSERDKVAQVPPEWKTMKDSIYFEGENPSPKP